MKKVLILGGILLIGYTMFKKSSNNNNDVAQTPIKSFADDYQNTHIMMEDNGYSIVVHNGTLYFDDTPGYIEQFFAKYGKKSATYPNFYDFQSKFPAGSGKSLSELFV